MNHAPQKIFRIRRDYNSWVANETLEDYALRYTPQSARKWSELHVANTAFGGVSFLALEAIGGAIALNYGFSTYTLENVVPESALPPVPVSLGTQATVQPVLGENTHLLLEKAKAGSLQQLVTLADSVEAPVAAAA